MFRFLFNSSDLYNFGVKMHGKLLTLKTLPVLCYIKHLPVAHPPSQSKYRAATLFKLSSCVLSPTILLTPNLLLLRPLGAQIKKNKSFSRSVPLLQVHFSQLSRVLSG